MKAGVCGTQPMTFTLHVEHQVVGGKTVLEQFEGVESFNDPPMTNKLHLEFEDDRDGKKLGYGNVVRAVDDS
jgi:hypothetical protein